MGVQVIVKTRDITKAGGVVTQHVIREGYMHDYDDGDYPEWIPPLLGACIQFGEDHVHMHESTVGLLWCDAKDPGHPVYAILEANNIPYKMV